MRKKTIFVLVISFVIFSCVEYSNATIMGTIESNRNDSDLGEFSEIDLSICYPQPVELGFDWSVLLSWEVTPDDVGATFFASADTHQSFEAFTSYLTNGIDDLLYLSDGHTLTQFPSDALPESTIISGIRGGVDLEGYIIDGIALTVNDFSLDYDPGAIKGGLTNYSYDITYTIYGSPVPEPCTVLLLGLGSLVLRKRCRRKV